MTTEFKQSLLSRFYIFNRIIYGLMAVLMVLIRISGITKHTGITVYYIVVPMTMLILDETIFFKKIKNLDPKEENIPGIIYALRMCCYILALASGGLITLIPRGLLVCIYLCMIYLVIQHTLFCDIFNSFTNYILITLTVFVAVMILTIFHYKTFVHGIWIIIYWPVVIVAVIVCDAMHMIFVDMVKILDDKYTKLFFANSDIVEENKQLVEFRERVEKVNSEINFQKINLTKVNNDLAESNLETRSLIEVMKHFASSFDIEKNAVFMLENVIRVKSAGAVGLYVESNVYMNEEPFQVYKSVNSISEDVLRQDLPDIYQMVKLKNTVDPIVLCENGVFKSEYLQEGRICNAVAFPAYENGKVYGVMVVTSSKLDFFSNGYSFYETSMMDFTSAMISTRLYLRAEDMAKKDGLTKIFNRTYFNQFYQELKEEIHETGDTLTVAMMDIDHFKTINDTYGHLAGDEVIKAVARVDDKYAKKYHGTAVRFGGEEFLLILRNVDIDTAYQILKDMHDEITSQVIEFEDMKININVSMGLASYRENCDRIDDLVDRADQAMYYSKMHGRGLIVINGREAEATPA
ncbi:MAG: GGDEF domain-containing protein [Eubacterium sp.]|nr:GGDEF domain-containing protein [Eubacterium sp.]